MSIFSTMQEAFPASGGRPPTDWELLAQTLRTVALWPYMMEDIGTKRLLQLSQLLQAQGYEPGTEEFAKAWEERAAPIFQKVPSLEKRGFARQLSYRGQIPWTEFAQRFGPQWESVWNQVTTAAQPWLTGLPQGEQQEVLNQVRAMVMAGTVPITMRPGGEMTVNQEALQRHFQTMLPNVITYLEKAPQTMTLGKWFAGPGNAPELAKAIENNPALRMWAAIPVDRRDPSRAVQAFQEVMGQRMQGLVSGAELAVKAYEAARDAGSYAEAAKAIKALDQAIALGFVPPTIAQGLKAQLDAFKAQTQIVTLPDGRKAGMNLQQAIEYQRQQTDLYLKTVIEPLGIAAAHGRVSPEGVQKALAGAARYGLDLSLVYKAVLSQESLRVSVTNAQLMNEHLRARQIQADLADRGLQRMALQERLAAERLQRAELEERGRVRRVLAAGTATDADYRLASIFFGLDAVGGMDLPTYIKAQTDQSAILSQADRDLQMVRKPRDAAKAIMSYRAALRSGITLDLQGLRSPATTGQVQDGLRNTFAFIGAGFKNVIANRAISVQDKNDLIEDLRSYLIDAYRKRLIPQSLWMQWMQGLNEASNSLLPGTTPRFRFTLPPWSRLNPPAAGRR